MSCRGGVWQRGPRPVGAADGAGGGSAAVAVSGLASGWAFVRMSIARGLHGPGSGCAVHPGPPSLPCALLAAAGGRHQRSGWRRRGRRARRHRWAPSLAAGCPAFGLNCKAAHLPMPRRGWLVGHRRAPCTVAAQVVLLQRHLAKALHSSQLTGVRRHGGGRLLARMAAACRVWGQQCSPCFAAAHAPVILAWCAAIWLPLPPPHLPARSRRSCCAASRSGARTCTSCLCIETPSGAASGQGGCLLACAVQHG